MARVPFPKGFTGRPDLPRTQRTLRNCFNNLKSDQDAAIIPRPGIVELNTTNSIARGQFVWRDNLYQIAGLQLIKITDLETGDYSVIGTIEGEAEVLAAIGQVEATFIVKGGNTYTLDPDDVLTDITANANMRSAIDLAYINGRIVYVPEATETDANPPLFFSDVGDAGSIQPLSFFEAEEQPDRSKAIFAYNRKLYVLGTDSIEVFQNVADNPTTPFASIIGAGLRTGYVGALVEYPGTYLFIGRLRNQGFGIFSVGGGGTPKVSNERIDIILQQYSQEQLENAIAANFQWDGHNIAVFTLEDHCFGYMDGGWFEMDSLINAQFTAFGARYIDLVNGKFYVGFEDKIGRLEDIRTDYGEPITKEFVTAMSQEDSNWFNVSSLEFGISMGYDGSIGDEAATVNLSTSRDGVTWNDPVYLELGKIGEYDKRLKWQPPGGVGAAQGFLAFKAYTTQNIRFTGEFIAVKM